MSYEASNDETIPVPILNPAHYQHPIIVPDTIVTLSAPAERTYSKHSDTDGKPDTHDDSRAFSHNQNVQVVSFGFCHDNKGNIVEDTHIKLQHERDGEKCNVIGYFETIEGSCIFQLIQDQIAIPIPGGSHIHWQQKGSQGFIKHAPIPVSKAGREKVIRTVMSVRTITPYQSQRVRYQKKSLKEKHNVSGVLSMLSGSERGLTPAQPSTQQPNTLPQQLLHRSKTGLKKLASPSLKNIFPLPGSLTTNRPKVDTIPKNVPIVDILSNSINVLQTLKDGFLIVYTHRDDDTDGNETKMIVGPSYGSSNGENGHRPLLKGGCLVRSDEIDNRAGIKSNNNQKPVWNKKPYCDTLHPSLLCKNHSSLAKNLIRAYKGKPPKKMWLRCTGGVRFDVGSLGMIGTNKAEAVNAANTNVQSPQQPDDALASAFRRATSNGRVVNVYVRVTPTHSMYLGPFIIKSVEYTDCKKLNKIENTVDETFIKDILEGSGGTSGMSPAQIVKTYIEVSIMLWIYLLYVMYYSRIICTISTLLGPS